MPLQHTDDCRTALRLANESAERQGSRYITTRHVLVGLATAPGSASESLSACGVNLTGLVARAMQSQVDDRMDTKVLSVAIQEVQRRNHNHLDTGHVLLALIADGNGDCAKILRSLNVDLDKLVAEIERQLPKPSFPLQEALSAFSNDVRVVTLRDQIEHAQRQIESHVGKAEFEAAAFYRDKKAETARELESLLERLWHDPHG